MRCVPKIDIKKLTNISYFEIFPNTALVLFVDEQMSSNTVRYSFRGFDAMHYLHGTLVRLHLPLTRVCEEF